MNFTLLHVCPFYLFLILLIFLSHLFLSNFFNFLSSVLYFLCHLLSSRVLIFFLRPFFWLFIHFHYFLPCCPFPSFFLSFFRPIPPSFLLSGAQDSTSCPQPAPFSSYSAVPSTTFLSSPHPLLRSSRKGQMYKTTSYARRGLMDCPSVPEGSPSVHVCTSSKSNWVLWCRSFCQATISPSTYICVDILLRKQ